MWCTHVIRLIVNRLRHDITCGGWMEDTTFEQESLAVSLIPASFLCSRGHRGVVSGLLPCHLLSLSPPRPPGSCGACESFSLWSWRWSTTQRTGSQWHHTSPWICVSVGGRQKVTPLVTVTHCLSHPTNPCSESDLIVVMSALYPQDLSVFFFVIIILKY